ncbi:putative N-acetyltransferase 16 (putative) [Phyllostomus discolor]|uniref:Putative N-acetyltransferase 16 (Putative) n=1 Tax=Phyllostomus discolor TaxID=89673 RepID=A0A834B9D0_9CHIR|nr:putative N-acetyltransferase 16 (putative) [Phyllostomus discolor]
MSPALGLPVLTQALLPWGSETASDSQLSNPQPLLPEAEKPRSLDFREAASLQGPRHLSLYSPPSSSLVLPTQLICLLISASLGDSGAHTFFPWMLHTDPPSPIRRFRPWFDLVTLRDPGFHISLFILHPCRAQVGARGCECESEDVERRWARRPSGRLSGARLYPLQGVLLIRFYASTLLAGVGSRQAALGVSGAFSPLPTEALSEAGGNMASLLSLALHAARRAARQDLHPGLEALRPRAACACWWPRAWSGGWTAASARA